MILLLPLLDEPGIFTDKACIENDKDIVFVGNFTDFPHVPDRKGLPPDEVGRCFHPDKGNLFCAILFYDPVQFIDVDVPLKRNVAFDLQGFIGKDLQNLTPLISMCALVVVKW